MLDTAMRGDQGTYVEAQLLIMERNGYPEETYYTFSYSPIPNDDGSVGGIICANSDDTQRVIGQRQLALLRDLATTLAHARTRAEICERAAAQILHQRNSHDLPFALIYMPDGDGSGFTLQATSGIDPLTPRPPGTWTRAVNFRGGSARRSARSACGSSICRPSEFRCRRAPGRRRRERPSSFPSAKAIALDY